MIIEINTLNNIVHALGKGGATKSDEFSEKFPSTFLNRIFEETLLMSIFNSVLPQMTMNSLGNFNPANDPESMVSFSHNRISPQSLHILSVMEDMNQEGLNKVSGLEEDLHWIEKFQLTDFP